MKLILSGAPASGKGTQCEKVVRDFNVVHLSTGDMLRAAVKANSELGRKAQSYMNKGELVPDALIIEMLTARLGEEDCARRGWLLDGFPRTRAQADALARAGIVPDAFVVLDVPDADIVDRVTGRRLDPETGKIYHVKSKPAKDPAVQARLVQRDDDTEQTARTRLETYKRNLSAVLGAVPAHALVRLDGARAPDAVYADVRAEILKRAWAARRGERTPLGTNFFIHEPARAGSARRDVPAPAPVAVCVHGIGAFSAAFDPLLPVLAELGFRVLAYDLFGRGHSDLPRDGRYDGAAHVEQLRELLEHTAGRLGLSGGGGGRQAGAAAAPPVVLVGHSMGGALAALFAERYPERVSHLVLIAPAGLMSGAAAAPIKLGRAAVCAHPILRRVLRRGNDKAQEDDFIDVSSDGARGALTLMRLQTEMRPDAFDAFWGCVKNFPLFGCEPSAAALGRSPSLQVLLLWGEEDSVVPYQANYAAWHTALSPGLGDRLEARVLPLGHGFFQEEPRSTADVLRTWARKAVPGARA